MATAAMRISVHKTLTTAALSPFEDLRMRKKLHFLAITTTRTKYPSKTQTFVFLLSKISRLKSITNQMSSKEDPTFILTIDPTTILKKTRTFKGILTASLRIKSSTI